jgi:hypothetical protein
LFAALGAALIVFICLRFGLLTLVVFLFVSDLPMTTNFSSWYMSYMIGVLLFVIAIAGWAFHTSLGGQKLFTGTLLEE